MTDLYRKSVLLFVFLWCVLSLPCTSYAQQFSEDTQMARLSPAMLGSVPAAGGDSCTGALLFSWYCSDNDPITDGGGCTVGADTAATLNSGATVNGTCNIPTTQDYIDIDWADDFIDPDQGHIKFYWYATNVGADDFALINPVYVDTNNYIALSKTGASDVLRLDHKAGGTVRFKVTTFSVTTGTTYKIVLRWSLGNTGDGTNDLQVCCDTTEAFGTTCESYSGLDLGTWAGSTGYLRLGNSANTNSNYYFDDIKIYNHWSNE